jgi:hypothetical protein
MQEHKRFAAAALHIVQPDAINGQEPAGRGVIALGLPGQKVIDQGRNRQGGAS